MATIQATNVLTGTTEGAKYNATGVTTEIWTAATTTSLANGDVISAMTLPAGCYVHNLIVGWSDVDSGTSFTWTAGYAGATAAFITTSTVGQLAGIASMNVYTGVGYTSTSDKVILITITATAGTPVAGSVRIALSYTASP